MILHPAIIALLAGSLLVSLMVLYAAFFGVRIVRRWNLASGSEEQLLLERRTYLVTTILAYAFGFELISLFLFIFTADDLCPLFSGAMCAAGTLFVNPFGYPALLLKTVTFVLAGLWLVLNHADARGCDYPLIRKKYLFLLALTPFVLAEGVTQGAYFLSLRANVITSCCGRLFSEALPGVTEGLVELPTVTVRTAFLIVMALLFTLGPFFLRSGRLGIPFSLAAAAALPVSTAALISFISPYIYELPTHHCPFCVLQREYSYVGYLLYTAILGGGVTGMGVGILSPFRKVPSLAAVLPPLRRRLALAALLFYSVFILTTVWKILSSGLRMP